MRLPLEWLCYRSFQCLDVVGELGRLFIGQLEVGHLHSDFHLLRIVQPAAQIFWRVGSDTCAELLATGKMREVWSDGRRSDRPLDRVAVHAAHLLEKGEDPAEAARRSGAQTLGIAGGDGSLAAVVGVAIETDATFVCVPTRPEFPEGFPLTFTEALTAHTPVVASDHPVFTRVLAEKALKGAKDDDARTDFVAKRLLARPFRPQEAVIVTESLAHLRANFKA